MIILLMKKLKMNTEQKNKKLLKITTILEEIYHQKGFDLPYFYNGFDDYLYHMNKFFMH